MISNTQYSPLNNSPGASSSHLSQSPHINTMVSSISETNYNSPPRGLDLIWPNWPMSLTGPELLRHLWVNASPCIYVSLTGEYRLYRSVDVFFVFHPHAHRLFHGPTFMHSLSLSPSHPKFPAEPVLHAICAVGSLYTAAVTSPPPPNFDEVAPGKQDSARLIVISECIP